MLVTLPRQFRIPLFQTLARPMVGAWVATSCSWASRGPSDRSRPWRTGTSRRAPRPMRRWPGSGRVRPATSWSPPSCGGWTASTSWPGCGTSTRTSPGSLSPPAGHRRRLPDRRPGPPGPPVRERAGAAPGGAGPDAGAAGAPGRRAPPGAGRFGGRVAQPAPHLRRPHRRPRVAQLRGGADRRGRLPGPGPGGQGPPAGQLVVLRPAAPGHGAARGGGVSRRHDPAQPGAVDGGHVALPARGPGGRARRRRPVGPGGRRRPPRRPGWPLPTYRTDAFTAGLLSDVGILLLAAKAPELLRRDEADLGFTHGGLGAYLLGLWGLAPGIVEAVAFHHEQPDQLPDAAAGSLPTRSAVALAVGLGMRTG